MNKKHNYLMKKALAALMVVMMAFSIVMPSSFQNAAYAKSTAVAKTANVPARSMVVSDNRVSMTAVKDIDISANFGYKVNPKNLVWTFGGKQFNQWKQWNNDSQGYIGKTFITFAKNPTASGTTVKATIKFGLIFNSTNADDYYYQYPDLIGTYNLQVKDKVKGTTISVPMKYNVYDDYHTYDEFKPALTNIEKSVKQGRYLEISSLGKTTGGREMYFAIIARDKTSVDKYLDMVKQMYNDPAALQKKIQDQNSKDDSKVAVWFNNTHPDEIPGSDAIIKLISDFATKDKITYKNKKVDQAVNSSVTTTIDVEKILDNEILLFNLTENPDGRSYNRRRNVNGFDLNRDYTYQTQQETRNFAAGMNKWAPLSLIDFHGFYPEMIIEPCTGPHNPNYEYDLLMDGMIPQAYLMGKAAVANTKYVSCDIPYLDFHDGFDDATPCYTSTFGMINGALAHTFEIPEANEDSLNALVCGGYAAINYVYQNKVKLLDNKLEMYKRQISNIDDKEVDRYYYDANGYKVGRPRGTNENYFPEYYVIPVDKSVQKNSSEAIKMVNQLLLNGIKVQKSTTAVKVGDTTYPAGSYIVPMHQAKRDFANVMLAKGTDESKWQAMYAEIVNDFPTLRGFDSYEIRISGAFDGKVSDVTDNQSIKTVIPEDAAMYVVKNASNETVNAINELLNSGKTVKMVTAAANGYKVGDYIVSKADLEAIKDKYDLDVAKVTADPTAVQLKPVKVFATKSSSASTKGQISEQTGFILRQLGFNVVDNPKDADIIVDGVGSAYKDIDMNQYIKSGKPYVGIGSAGLKLITKNNLINGLEISDQIGNYYEGVLRSIMTENNVITSGYDKDSLLYCTDGEFITKAPQNAVVLERVSDKDDFYVEGWWPGHDAAKGQILGIQYNNMVLFANDLTNKAHPSEQFRLLSNAIYSFQVK